MKLQLVLFVIFITGALGQDADTVSTPAVPLVPVDTPTEAPAAAVVGAEGPAAPAEGPAAPAEAPVVPAETPVVPAETPVAPAQEAPAETPVAPAQEAPAAPTEAPVVPVEAALAEAPQDEAEKDTTTTTTTAAAPNTTTTTISPPTPTPTPTLDKYFRVTQNNVTCIMFGGDVTFSVTYPTESGKSSVALISVPSPSNDTANVKSTGSCLDNPQYINISWGPTNSRSSFQLSFNSTGDKWELVSTEVSLYLDENVFSNATNAGEYLRFFGQYPGLSFVKVDTNSSFVCRAAVTSTNFTTSISKGNSTAYSVSSSAIGFSAQAYNSIPNDTQLQEGSRCESDITSDLVPIAVGCALAGLVVLVLISYLVGRRRRSAAYQSV